MELDTRVTNLTTTNLNYKVMEAKDLMFKKKDYNIVIGETHINVSIRGALFDINMIMSAIHELQDALRLCKIEKEIIL